MSEKEPNLTPEQEEIMRQREQTELDAVYHATLTANEDDDLAQEARRNLEEDALEEDKERLEDK
jgi:hypothetical protein